MIDFVPERKVREIGTTGPWMYVESISERCFFFARWSCNAEVSEREAVCVWLDGTNVKRGSFSLEKLIDHAVMDPP